MRFLRRLAHWWRFAAKNSELDEELAFHRDAIERDLIAQGHSPPEARDAARRAMGNETLTREDARAVWIWPSLDATWQDARATFRSFRRSPAFVAGVLLTFALGFGANAAMFSVIDRLLFRTPPLMRDPAAVHRVYMYKLLDGVERGTGGQYARYVDLARGTTSFASVAAHVVKQLAVGVGQDARELPVAIVTATFFDFFDAPPVLGRYFTPAEDALPSGAPSAVLSYAAWQTRYAGSRDVIGASLKIDAVVYTIVGVTPPGFVGLWPRRPPAAFIPASTHGASVIGPAWRTTFGSAFGLATLVRRKPGVSIDGATADLTQAFIRSLRAEWGREGSDDRIAAMRPRVVAGSVLLERGPRPAPTTRVATWLGGVTILVLLIACANVANLLLTRALGQRRETAVRLALGVSRSRLLSQLVTESMMLAVAGSVLGLLVATWITSTLGAWFLPGTEPMSVIGDMRTLLFMGVLTVGIGLFTSVLPMRQATRLVLTDDLKAGARSIAQPGSRARAALLVLQCSLSVVLLVGAGLFVRSARNVSAVHLGFDADSVLVVEPEMRDVVLDSAQWVALRLRLLEAATTVPGVHHASLQQAVPFGGMSSWPIWTAGVDSVEKFGRFEFNAVSQDYFATLGTRILRGRGFAAGDVAAAQWVLVVGTSMAEVLWPGQDPLGKCVRIGIPAETAPCRYVVGVAEDIHARGFGPQERNFYYYLPAAQWRHFEGGLFARVSGDARHALEPLRRRLQQEMPGASYVTVARLAELTESESRSWDMGATLFTSFGILALLLAAAGLYSVIAYGVAERRREMAVRMALGAAPGDIARLVVSAGMRYALTGAAAGALIALVAGRWVAPLLFDQSPRDPQVLGIVVSALLVVAACASVIPAIRGARVDPNAVLRSE
jgi:predicted permease